jgi:uncharacterized protein (DUF488 family)
MTHNTKLKATRRITSPCTKQARSGECVSGGNFFTVGHSTRSLEEFIGLLHEVDVRLVADVRTVPHSRRNPQFNREVLEQALTAHQIKYMPIVALGGLRPKQRDVASSVNAFWHNKSFHNYADYAMSESFRDGLARLRELGHARTCAIMCAEALWWRCHRRIIADYLLAANETVLHILGQRQIVPAHLTSAAQSNSAGVLTYPADV